MAAEPIPAPPGPAPAPKARCPMSWLLVAEARWELSRIAARLERRTGILRKTVPARAATGAEVARIIRAVDRAARLRRGPTTCLERTFAVQSLLARRGLAATLRIGVRRAAPVIEAHAWLEPGPAAGHEYSPMEHVRPSGRISGVLPTTR